MPVLVPPLLPQPSLLALVNPAQPWSRFFHRHSQVFLMLLLKAVRVTAILSTSPFTTPLRDIRDIRDTSLQVCHTLGLKVNCFAGCFAIFLSDPKDGLSREDKNCF